MAFENKQPVVLASSFAWYIARFIRHGVLRVFFKTIGKYGFRKIGRSVVIDGLPEFLYPGADIKLGDYVRIGKRCVFQGSANSSISIGRRVSINDGCYITSLFSIEIGAGTSIGEYCSIRDYNHGFADATKSVKDQGYYGGPIKIGENCWIGRGAIVLPNVNIGSGVVIGANSVVLDDIPDGAVAVGAPARVIRIRTEAEKG